MPRHQRRKAKRNTDTSPVLTGVERDDDEEVTTSEEILKALDRRRWELDAEDVADDTRRSAP